MSHLLELAMSNIRFKDILVHERRPLKINGPGGIRVAQDLKDPVSGAVVVGDAFVPSKDEIEELLNNVDQDWRARITSRAIDEGLSIGGKDRLRLNVFYEGNDSLAAVVRRFPVSPPTLQSIKAPTVIEDMLSRRSGLILVCGQTGAGKSTTCAAMLNHLSSSWATHIVTIESPIEFKHEDARATFSQREVGSPGLSGTALGVQDAMRQSPGVIYIAEMRDRDTAEALFYALESGHLVIATLHARSPLEAAQRLLRFFPNDRAARCEALASNLVGIVCQALVPIVAVAESKVEPSTGERERIDFKAFFEVIPHGERVQELISSDKFTELGKELAGVAAGTSMAKDLPVTFMNQKLAEAVIGGQVLRSDAIASTLDPKNLVSRLGQAR